MINIPYQIIVPESSPRGFHPGFFVQAGTQVGKPFGRLPGRGVPPGRRNDGEVGATRELPRAHRCGDLRASFPSALRAGSQVRWRTPYLCCHISPLLISRCAVWSVKMNPR